MPPV
jgi:tight adherence protein C